MARETQLKIERAIVKLDDKEDPIGIATRLQSLGARDYDMLIAAFAKLNSVAEVDENDFLSSLQTIE